MNSAYNRRIAEVVASLEFRNYAELSLQDQIYASIIKNRVRGSLDTCTSDRLKQVLNEITDTRLHRWFLRTDPSVVARALRLAYNDIRTL